MRRTTMLVYSGLRLWWYGGHLSWLGRPTASLAFNVRAIDTGVMTQPRTRR
jgi:hypothetical protein